MCGITGIWTKERSLLPSIKEMTASLLHRGPDAQHHFIDENKGIALGHTRLSIIDLSNEADQPFVTEDGRYRIVFNGEIYNFKDLRLQLQKSGVSFRTSSDTEVFVKGFACWGTKIAQKLRGMFAACIYDSFDNKLFLFRDAIGKKPFYYYKDEKVFAFASEIKSLLVNKYISARCTVDPDAINQFLHLGYIPEPHSIYRAIRKFPAGSIGEVSFDLKTVFHQFWNITDHLEINAEYNDLDAKQRLNILLDDAVEKRLISDVPLGTFLSGGVDSSVVTAIAAKLKSSPVKTFTIGFRENKFDESKHAAEIARHLKTDHHEFILSEQEGAEILNQYITHFDEPFADTSAIPTMLVSKLAKQYVTVTLTGDGGDELFQGYGAYTWANRLDTLPWKLTSSALSKVLKIGGDRYQRISRLLGAAGASERSHIFSQEQYFFSQHEIRDKLLKKNILEPFDYADPPKAKHLSAAEKQALFDIQYYLKDDLLVKVDRASMFYGLECRSPLLDQKLIEFAWSLPYQFKKRDGISKWLLKQVLYDYVPRQLVDRRKWGFSVPLAKWLRQDLHELVDKYLNKDILEDTGIVNADYVLHLKKQFESGSHHLYNRLWLIIVLHKWMQDNHVK